MTNRDIAAIFAEMEDLMTILGEDSWRARAFGRIARALERLPESAAGMLAKGTLDRAPGIGEGGVHRIKEIMRTGTTVDHSLLVQRLPVGLRDLLAIRGVGPRTLRVAYCHLRIQTLEELEAAARTGKLAKLPRIGLGQVQRIIDGIEAHKRRAGRLTIATAWRRAWEVAGPLREIPGVSSVEVAGSLRRRKETTKDVDVLVGLAPGGPGVGVGPGAIVEAMVRLPPVVEVLSRSSGAKGVGEGSGRASVRLRSGLQADLVVLPAQQIGAGLHYFTGSKDHNIALRLRANRMGLHISEKGVWTRGPDGKGETLLNPCPHEAEVFAAVGLPWIPPELREGAGEMEAAEAGRLPMLVEAGHLQGDLHLHTTHSDGAHTVEEMLVAARARGHRYLAVTDHSYRVRKDLDAYLRALRERAGAVEGIQLLAGIEVDIETDGSLQVEPRRLAAFDWVVASVHGAFELPEAQQTNRVIRAMETGVVDVIGHPTGRKFSRRGAQALDLDRLLAAALRTGVALEINGQPDRLDLDDRSARRTKNAGVPVVLSSDAHHADELANVELAVGTARRGWIEPGNVVNAYPWRVIAQRRHQRLRRAGFTHGLGGQG